MTTHNDWRLRYTARLHELWRQERDAGSRPEAADLTTASQQDFITLAQRSKERRDDALKRKIDKLLDKARILTDERRAEVERAARRLAAQHSDPDGVNAWLTQFFHPDSAAPPHPPFRVVPEEPWPDLPPGWRWLARWQAAHDDGTTTATYNDPAPVVRLAQKHTPVERPPRPEAPETLFDIDDYAAPMPGAGIRAVQGR
jgi:hypothetical protein